MSAIGEGNFYRGLAQNGLTNAAQEEQNRNIYNNQIKRQNDASKAQFGATIGSAAGGIAGSALLGASAGSVVPGLGTAIGGLIGAAAGLFGSKLF